MQIENGPSATLRTESAARGIASYILKKYCATGDALGVCILTSPLSLATAGRRGHKALIALRAAVTLANSGIRVLALVPQITNSSSPSDDGAAHQALRDAVRALSSSGARIVRDVRDLGSECGVPEGNDVDAYRTLWCAQARDKRTMLFSTP